MIASRLIEEKRDGRELDADDLEAFLTAYLRDELPHYQMTAFLMAVLFQGLSPAELERMVHVMVRSGAVLELDHLPGPKADKHSTGGVGDKVSLVLAPLAAELGLFVPMMSGRGLGHSGGTLDKLEAIPGFRTDVSLSEFGAILESVGCAMIGQSAEIAPLDKRLYELRNVTGTVPAIPLIAASIMSKKLAEGLDALVLDVKAGSGALLPDLEDALALARTLVDIGVGRGTPTVALVTAMDRPLGRAIGSALEVGEAVECLHGEGPSDLRDVVTALVAEMLVLAGSAPDREEAEHRCREALASGAALERFRRLVEAHGGDPGIINDPGRLPSAPLRREVQAGARGVVQSVSPKLFGQAVVEMGGGRLALGDASDPGVGFVVDVRPGDHVALGDRLGEIHAADDASAELAAAVFREAIAIGCAVAPPPLPLISHRVTRDGVEERGGPS